MQLAESRLRLLTLTLEVTYYLVFLREQKNGQTRRLDSWGFINCDRRLRALYYKIREIKRFWHVDSSSQRLSLYRIGIDIPKFRIGR